MKNSHTLRLNAASIGSGTTHPNQPVAPTATAAHVEQPAPGAIRGPATGSRKQLLALLAVELSATFAAVAATGTVHSTIFRIAAAGLAFSVALVVAIGAAACMRRNAPAVAAATAAPRRPAAGRRPLGKARVGLLFVMAIGFATYFGGGGTFAGFTAQTANPNQGIASGTLLLQNTVSTLCESKTGESNNNVNANCNAAFSFTNQEPGVFSGTATVTIKNSGSLNASKFYLFAPYANGVLSSPITAGSAVTSLSLYASGHGPAGLEGTVSNGDHILVTYGGSTQTFIANGSAAAGATTINVNSLVATANFPAGATVEDTDSDTTVANTNCYDTQVSNLGFNPATNNPLCAASILYVQEQTGGFNYCWWGSGKDAANGQCDAPISSNPTALGTSSNQTIAAGTYTVSALKGNIKSGDTVAFTEGASQVTCPASSDYYYGATSITVGACTVVNAPNGVFDNNAVITDTSSLARIAIDATHSISKFDQTANSSSKVELVPVTANGTKTPSGTDLASNATRTFIVGVVIQGGSTPQNQLQSLKSTFGLNWHIDQ